MTPGTSVFPRKLIKTPVGLDVNRFKSYGVRLYQRNVTESTALCLLSAHLDSVFIAETSDRLQARGTDVELRNDDRVRRIVHQDSFAVNVSTVGDGGGEGEISSARSTPRQEVRGPRRTHPPALPTLASLTVKSHVPRLTITTLSDKFGVDAGNGEHASFGTFGSVEVK